MDSCGIRGTFNLNSGLFAQEGTVYPPGQIHRRMTKKSVLALYGGSAHEVAAHGLTHPYLTQMPLAAAVRDVMEDRVRLEALFGKIVRGMAYPYGAYSENLAQGLQAAGIVYSRTVKITESFSLPNDWMRLDATCHHDHPALGDLVERFVKDTPRTAPWLFYLWGHSYEFEEHENWSVIENFCRKTSGKPDIWYATNIEIYDYVQAYNRLQFSAEGNFVYNPNIQTVWVERDQNVYAVRAGEFCRLN
jgi:hypothetical protein